MGSNWCWWMPVQANSCLSGTSISRWQKRKHDSASVSAISIHTAAGQLMDNVAKSGFRSGRGQTGDSSLRDASALWEAVSHLLCCLFQMTSVSITHPQSAQIHCGLPWWACCVISKAFRSTEESMLELSWRFAISLRGRRRARSPSSAETACFRGCWSSGICGDAVQGFKTCNLICSWALIPKNMLFFRAPQAAPSSAGSINRSDC